jgi:hypothetical protein
MRIHLQLASFDRTYINPVGERTPGPIGRDSGGQLRGDLSDRPNHTEERCAELLSFARDCSSLEKTLCPVENPELEPFAKRAGF